MIRRSQRHGLAPLEFVLIFPLLLLLLMCGLWAARAGYAKMTAISTARCVAWEQVADAGTPLDRWQEPPVSWTQHRDQQAVVAKPPVAVPTTTAITLAGRTDQAWDHTDFPFPRLTTVIGPHYAQLVHVAQFIPAIQAHVRVVRGAQRLDLLKNPQTTQFFVPAAEHAEKRAQALATMTRSLPSMTQAIGKLFQMAAKNPFAAPWYLFEAAVVLRGQLGIAKLHDAARSE